MRHIRPFYMYQIRRTGFHKKTYFLITILLGYKIRNKFIRSTVFNLIDILVHISSRNTSGKRYKNYFNKCVYLFEISSFCNNTIFRYSNEYNKRFYLLLFWQLVQYCGHGGSSLDISLQRVPLHWHFKFQKQQKISKRQIQQIELRVNDYCLVYMEL